MKQKILFVLLAISFLVINSCNDDIVGPQPGERNYTWTVDTLIIPFTKLYSISGSSPSDLWAVGPGGGLDKTIYHFDGTRWATDGISRNLSPEDVFAFSYNNVWIAGQDGKIWNNHSGSWKEVIRYDRLPETRITFFEIWGDSPSNIFATGFSGPPENMTSLISRYNGTGWNLHEFPNLKYNFIKIYWEANTGKYYLLGLENRPDGGEIWGLFEYNGDKEIKQIFKSSNSIDSSAVLRKTNNEIFFGIGRTINRYINGEFRPFLKVDEADYWNGFYGRSEKDIFLQMAYGIAHYNGNDIKYLYKNPDKIWITDAILFEKEVFFLAVAPTIGGNLIIHGRLN